MYFLGTSASVPTRERNMTSVVLRLMPARGVSWMVDCAEGTQHQILRSPLQLPKIEKLFVTHLHGDHIYGIPGLLSSRAMQQATQPFTVYGPVGIRRYVEDMLGTREALFPYPLQIEEVAPGVVFEDFEWVVTAERLDHGIESYGYRFQEKDRPGHIDEHQLEVLGIPKGPHLRDLKEGRAITLPDGRTIVSAQVVGPSIPGRAVVICGDTRPTPQTVELARGADVLVHEATFCASEQE
ncbi:MAG: ribonuclease Z, partial [Firmicutes bacterium]|nr:ribonuclease Z [Bacillota bacterium]